MGWGGVGLGWGGVIGLTGDGVVDMIKNQTSPGFRFPGVGISDFVILINSSVHFRKKLPQQWNVQIFTKMCP